MAAPSGATSRQNETYYLNSVAAAPMADDFDTYAEIDALAVDANVLKDVVDRGSIGGEANPIRFTPFGAKTSKSIPGVPEQPEFSLTVAFDASDTLHAALRDADIGSGYQVVVKTVKGAGEEVKYAYGTLAAANEETADGSPRQFTFTFALETDWVYDDKP